MLLIKKIITILTTALFSLNTFVTLRISKLLTDIHELGISPLKSSDLANDYFEVQVPGICPDPNLGWDSESIRLWRVDGKETHECLCLQRTLKNLYKSCGVCDGVLRMGQFLRGFRIWGAQVKS